MRHDLLRIYLNDHFAGSTGAAELARRCRDANAGTPLAAFLEAFLRDLDGEREVLLGLIRETGGAPNPLKQAGAWLLEKLGRAKLNGALVTYSDLSRLLELEMLLLGVRGKRALWDALERVREGDTSLGALDFPALQAQAERHLAALESLRLDAARRAFVRSAHAGA
jgi:hypothetical protein